MFLKKSELELIVQVDLEDEPYQFYVAGVFYDPAHNAYRVDTDSGCSCTYPWEHKGEVFTCEPVGLSEAIKSFRAKFNDLVSLDDRESAIAELREHARKVGARK